MVITAETPVRDIVVETPTAIPVLEQFGIDYCCGGTHTLAEACSKRDQNLASVLDELQRQQNTSSPEEDWRSAPLRDLIGQIMHKHHAFARAQLGLIRELATKVERRHRHAHQEIYRISGVLAAINAELTHHFSCEEDVLFPYIEQLDGNQGPVRPAVFVSAQQPVARMMKDHNQTGDELCALREMTNNYQPPADACTTYRALYRAMEDLEQDLHQHIHLENNILFPRALELEKERA
jgi:regulator of cell morphogenesis and NO signaling